MAELSIKEVEGQLEAAIRWHSPRHGAQLKLVARQKLRSLEFRVISIVTAKTGIEKGRRWYIVDVNCRIDRGYIQQFFSIDFSI